MASYPNLERIGSPADVRTLDRRDLGTLATELRAFLIESVSRTGGHLSSNLGTVELTIALHHVFNTPHDRIVWDVGHQTYGHKILTGRREAMAGLRHFGGISGFPRRCESAYDTFGTAHSSTSISAALGMAVAARARGEDRHAVAVIGDVEDPQAHGVPREPRVLHGVIGRAGLDQEGGAALAHAQCRLCWCRTW